MLSFTTAIRETYQLWTLLPLLLIFLLYRTITGMKMWLAQFVALLLLLFHSRVKAPSHPRKALPISAQLHARFITWRPPCRTSFWPVQSHFWHRLLGATGRLNGIWMWPCLCIWMDGRQSLIYLHFIYHCCCAVTIPLLVRLYLLFDLLLSSSPAVCMLDFNHWHTVTASYVFFVNKLQLTPSSDIWWTLKARKSKIAIDPRNWRHDAAISVLMSQDETRTKSTIVSCWLLEDATYIIDHCRVIFFFPPSISPPEIWSMTRKTAWN